MGALTGIRVVEFEGWIAGSLLGMLLADQGAEVICVARPGAPIYNRPGSEMLARGKRSIVLDLCNRSDRDMALRLTSTADIVIENLRPGSLNGLGVGCGSLRAINPRLIHVSLVGFASDDLTHAGLAAFESIIAAAIGMFSEINLLKPTLGMDPVYTPLALPSIYGAVQGAIACNAALFAREKTGEGAALEVPLAAAAGMAMSSIFMNVEGAPSHYDTPKLPKIVKSVVLPILRRYWRNSPKKQQRFYAKIKSAVPALMSAYLCADGRQVYVFAIDHASLTTRLLNTLGLLEEACAFGFINANPYDGPVEAPNFATTAGLTPQAQTWLRTKIAEKLLVRPAAEWEALFAASGLPAALVRTTDEWVNWPPLQQSDAIVLSGGRLEPGRQCWFPGEEITVLGAVPARNENGPTLRAEALGIALPAATPISPRSDTWQPLAGIKVIDFASMVAGPVAGRTLAELGAEVIKIESPHPHHGPRLTCWYGIDVNQGKQSILIDLKSVDGYSIMTKLVQDADVVLHNFTPAAAARLKVDALTLKIINPDILICEIAAYSGPSPSDLDERHGYDPVLQMASGISARYGSLDSPELHGIASCVDNLTGYSATFGIVAALAANARGQSLRWVKTSLVQAANLIQFPFSAGLTGSKAYGQTALGENKRVRLWRTSNGWIFSAPYGVKQEAAFDQLLARNDFRHLSSADVISQMRSAGIAAVEVNRLATLQRSFAQSRQSIRTVRQTVEELTVTQVEPCYLRIDGMRLPPISPTQKPGASTVRVMKNHKFTDAAIQSCVKSRAVATQLSKEFLP